MTSVQASRVDPALPVIETGRLLLRPPVLEDFESWAAFMADPEATAFLGGAQSRSVAWRGFVAMVGSWQVQGFAMFSVIEKATGRWLGRLGPWQPEGWPGTEVGWSLDRSAWGRGYASEGAAAAIDWAFEHLGWTEVIHCIDPANLPSQRVAQRLGSTLRGPGILPEPLQAFPIEIWGQTRGQWRARAR